MERNDRFFSVVLSTIFSLATVGCVSAVAQSYAYVPGGTTVSVIDTGTNTVVDTISGLSSPFGVAITPNGAFAM